MRKLLLLLLFVSFSVISFSQVYKAHDASARVNGADIVRYEEYTKVPVFIHFLPSVNLSEDKAITFSKSFFAGTGNSFELKNVQKNKTGDQTHRYVQTFNGIPVEFSAWNLQVRNNRVFAMNGDLLDNPQVVSNFSLSENQALDAALAHVGADLYMWQDAGEEQVLKTFKKDQNASYFPQAIKVLVPAQASFKNNELHSAYKFDIYAKKPHKRLTVYVDAGSGEVLFSISQLYGSDEVGTAQTQYSGTQQINTEYTGGQYILNDNTRADGIHTWDCNMSSDYDAAVDFYDADNNWNNVNAELDEYATDGHFATASTYDYYMDIHGRNSIDGNGYQLWSFVHYNLVEAGYGSNLNAFWNGQWMTYGDGTETVTPLTTVDICGHEITHGLTSYTCGLNYQDESGAINEAFSDIFGTAVEFYAAPAYADYLIGEDIGQVFRSIQDPNSTNKPDTYHGNFWWFDSGDYGGVHTNGIVLCYGFYLLCEGGSGTNDLENDYTVTAIGMEKAEQIFFRLQTVYLTNTSDYHDAWFYTMQAAADLYGACSPEVKSVGDMFYAIGVAPEPYVDDVHAGFDALFTENCSAPFTVQFVNQSYNGDGFFWNFGDGQTSTQINPSHTYTSMGFFDVQLYVDGTACGNDVVLKDDFVVIDESVPCATIFPTSGNSVVNECSGIIYDSGGPVGNYYDNSNASLTIHAVGSENIVLNIEEFNIEAGSGFDCDYDYIAFYDGSSTSASLINSTYYCNTNGNPGTITSTGEYLTIQFYSDGGLNMSGFKIQFDCVGGENPPAPYFSANKVYTCDGLISFDDNTLNNPLTWAWDFGDGNTSDEQNPIHDYTTSGVFTVSLEVGNSFGTQELIKTDYITVELPNAPVIGDVVACSDQEFAIDYIGDGQLRWYGAPNDETPIYVGNNWMHPVMPSPTTYWVEELFAGETNYVGSENAEVGGGYFGNPDYIHYLIFDAYEPFLLESIFINADGDGYRTIALRNSSMEILSQKTVFCPNGAWRVEVNMDIPVGTNLQLAGMGTPNLYRNNVATTVDFPYNIDGVVSIKQSSAGTNPLDYYYYFYDWKIRTYECVSAKTQVELIPETCMGVKSELISNISISPNPGTGLFVFANLGNDRFDYTIIDISGKEVLKANSDKNSFDISNCADGVYFVKIVSDYGTKTLKLVKN